MSIEKAYDTWSSQYDTNENKTRDLDIIATKETLSKYPFSKVLELGCGTGKNTSYLLQKAEQVIGLDFSEEMLNIARAKIKDTRVEFRKADLNLNWDIENQFAELITSSLTLEHIQDLGHIFEQAYEKLKANGIFFICELHPFKQYLGSKARFETEDGVQELEVYTHHLSEYIENAKANKFSLVEINEWFDHSAENEIARLISFVFKK